MSVAHLGTERKDSPEGSDVPSFHFRDLSLITKATKSAFINSKAKQNIPYMGGCRATYTEDCKSQNGNDKRWYWRLREKGKKVGPCIKVTIRHRTCDVE
jgi:hypothetical protein